MLIAKHDPEANAVHIRFNDKPYAYGKDLDDLRRIDYAEDGTPMGVELLYVDDGVDLDGLPHRDLIAEVRKPICAACPHGSW